MAPSPAAHVSPFAGSWYPDSPADLAALLDQLSERSLQRTGPALLPRPLAFVVPHAGLAYSGAVAASAYRHLRAAAPGRIFLLGFSHRLGPPCIAIPDISSFETPLGAVEIDSAAAHQLAAARPFSVVAESRVCDHSVEIQLPLLRQAVPGVPIVPLYVGPLEDTWRSAAAEVLARIVGPGDVLLASSDLTHYGRSFAYQPFPAGRDLHRRLYRLDSQLIESAGSLDSALFRDTLRDLASTVCGRDPIALLLETLTRMAGEDVFQQTLDYQTSAELTGDYHHSVSYAALGYFRADSFQLDAESQQALLASARATLQFLRETGHRRPIVSSPALPALLRHTPLFVSLHHDGQLFGCVGTRSAPLPLAEAAPELALSAALDDPRFPQTRALPDNLHIEISVLTPMRRIRDWRTFRVGRDGATLDFGTRSELLLPQVAARGPWTAVHFLEALSEKAGLAPSGYRDPHARLSVFRAQLVA
jgi:MEMO1 family protein